ncbi:hypothetical protein ABIF94_005760 [Bradyrhizobium ottawaense]
MKADQGCDGRLPNRVQQTAPEVKPSRNSAATKSGPPALPPSVPCRFKETKTRSLARVQRAFGKSKLGSNCLK